MTQPFFEAAVNNAQMMSLEDALKSVNARPIIGEVMTQLGRDLVVNLMEHTPVGARGRLRSLTRYRLGFVQEGNEFVAELAILQPAGRRSRSGGVIPYRPFVVSGTSPHMPPFQPLLDWVRRRLHLTGKQARKTTWAIVRNIERYGSKPNPYNERALEEAHNYIAIAAQQMGVTMVVEVNTVYGMKRRRTYVPSSV